MVLKDVTFQELWEQLVQHLVYLPDNDPALFLRTCRGVQNQSSWVPKSNRVLLSIPF